AGFFASALRGDEKPRPGFDKCARAFGQLTSLRGSCPQGERSESIPPSPPYLKKSPHENAGFFASVLIKYALIHSPKIK
ncbi:hypothetical protein, partial [Enterobacter sp.]|uniref:hypothetical protein n=1 Tax=Enterobacter sp. TaxID=42895 RepID=UPI00296FC9B4